MTSHPDISIPEEAFGLRIREELGRGTFGRFLHAEEPESRRPFALKIVTVRPSDDQRIVGRIHAEFEVGRIGAHRMLRRYHALHSRPESAGATEFGVVMELIDAPPPTRVPFPASETVEILRQVANAVVSLHAHGYVHAGLSHRALYLTTLGRPRLGSLGDAARIGEVKPLRIGVPGFIAPEVAAGTPIAIGTTSFLFASLAYVMLVNRFPRAVRLAGLASSQITDTMIGPDARLDALVPEVPAALAEFVERSLVADPAERPALEKLLDALRWHDAQQAATTHEPDVPRPVVPLSLPQRSNRNPRSPESRDDFEAHRVTLAGHAFGYRIGRWLGDGAWSRIYLVERPSTGEAFAMKHVMASTSGKRRPHEQLVEEWTRCRALNHPALRRIHALEMLGTDPLASPVLGLVMELLDSTPLVEGRMPRPLLVDTLRAVASALGYIHSKGLVHANVRPRAIFVSELGQIKLAGTGQMVADGTELRRSRLVPGFIPPEMVRVEPVTSASDVFGFAATAFNLVTGLIAPEAAMVRVKGAEVRSHRIGSDAPLDAMEPGLGPRFGKLAKQALSLKPEHRPSIHQLAEALERE